MFKYIDYHSIKKKRERKFIQFNIMWSEMGVLIKTEWKITVIKHVELFWLFLISYVQFNLVTQAMSNSLQTHGLQHARVPCSSPTPRACSNSCPSSRWCHPTISSSVVPFSSHLQSFPASGSFPISQFFASGGQSIGASASASVLPMNIQDWPPLGRTGWISLQSKGLSRVFSNTTVQKHQLFRLRFL